MSMGGILLFFPLRLPRPDRTRTPADFNKRSLGNASYPHITACLPSMYRLRACQLHVAQICVQACSPGSDLARYTKGRVLSLYLIHACSLADATEGLFLGYYEKPDEGFVSVPVSSEDTAFEDRLPMRKEHLHVAQSAFRLSVQELNRHG